ncbi:Nitrogen permease regulator 3 [Beauveria bassiana]|uniref:Nitrogen permease regulator 3 n=1 Tax=Beauveria bassiana TaxID=176275 RepID=A0A2N6NH03_BEABA|nr:Nitrogen permease regulator 3 [Beauveria bassiana]
MSFVNPDNLIAVALVINRSRDGPAFVFHYPPAVLPVSADAGQSFDTADSEDVLLERLSRPLFRDAEDRSSSKHGHARSKNWHSYDEHTMSDSGTQTVPWESVAGFPTRDLASILTPARPYHKKLFQLSLDPLLCVSYPIHVPESGKWKRVKKSKAGRASSAVDDDAQVAWRAPLIAVSAPCAPSAPADSDAAVEKEKDKDKEKKEEEEEKRSSMTMFNLVFILRPRKEQTRELVEALYSNIAKKVNKAFKYSQQHSDFVWKESKKILASKDRAREDKLLQQSSLAASVHDIYEAISQNRIATLHLDTAAGLLSPSVQIPAPFYVADLPPDEARRARGLWLTTANAFLTQDFLEEPGFLDRNFGLLLMEDEKKIVAELQADGDPNALPMVEFVRISKPTMSNILSLSQVRKFAQHFIFWRRAIAIPPLHARDTYIVSPNCDLARLPEAAVEWQRAFPLAPPLANLLSDMSVCPRPYKTFCPSKVHRPLYLRMLAWLMRGGWVTQLCTFAYVVVWPEIIYQVEYEMEADELEGPTTSASPRSAGAESSVSPMSAATVLSRPHNPLSRAAAIDDDSAAIATVPSPISSSLALSASLSESTKIRQASITSTATVSDSSIAAGSSLPSTPGAVSIPSTTERAAEAARLERIAQRVSREAADKAAAHARKAIPEATPHPSTNRSLHLAGIAPHIILDAKKATGRESRYLAAIVSRLRDDRVRQAWSTMCRYFDGHSALERVALQEEMKRKEAWMLLTAMSEYLVCTRHW